MFLLIPFLITEKLYTFLKIYKKEQILKFQKTSHVQYTENHHYRKAPSCMKYTWIILKYLSFFYRYSVIISRVANIKPKKETKINNAFARLALLFNESIPAYIAQIPATTIASHKKAQCSMKDIHFLFLFDKSLITPSAHPYRYPNLVLKNIFGTFHLNTQNLNQNLP